MMFNIFRCSNMFFNYQRVHYNLVEVVSSMCLPLWFDLAGDLVVCNSTCWVLTFCLL